MIARLFLAAVLLFGAVPAQAQTVFQNGDTLSAAQLNTFAQTLDTAAPLSITAGTAGLEVRVRGLVTISDGLGGDFYWNPTDTTSPDGVNVIKVTSVTVGRWDRVFEVLPIQTNTVVAGACTTSCVFGAADLFRKTRRSNAGSAMTDTFPASTATGLVNGTRLNVGNIDASASDTITAGAGTTIAGGATYVIGPGRDVHFVYNLATTDWRLDANTGTAMLQTAAPTTGQIGVANSAGQYVPTDPGTVRTDIGAAALNGTLPLSVILASPSGGSTAIAGTGYSGPGGVFSSATGGIDLILNHPNGQGAFYLNRTGNPLLSSGPLPEIVTQFVGAGGESEYGSVIDSFAVNAKPGTASSELVFQNWQTGFQLANATLSGGTGYATNDFVYLTPSSGNASNYGSPPQPATIKITHVTGGVPDAFVITNTGSFPPSVATFTGTITGGTTLTDSGTSGTIAIGQKLYRTDGTPLTGNPTITGGSDPTWTISPAQTDVASVSMSTVDASGPTGFSQIYTTGSGTGLTLTSPTYGAIPVTINTMLPGGVLYQPGEAPQSMQIKLATGTLLAPSWTTAGIAITGTGGQTFIDTTTSGTIGAETINSFPSQTVQCVSACTISNLETLRLGTPVAGSNVTATNKWSLTAIAGIQGNGGLTVNGGAVNLNSSSNFAVNVATGSSTGTVTIGNSSNPGKTVLAGISTGTNADFACLSSGGVVLLQSSACTISSLRFKKDVRDADNKKALDQILSVQPINFEMKAQDNRDPNYATRQTGLSAESVARIMPECSIYEDDMKTPKSWRQECVIAKLVGAVHVIEHANDNSLWHRIGVAMGFEQ